MNYDPNTVHGQLDELWRLALANDCEPYGVLVDPASWMALVADPAASMIGGDGSMEPSVHSLAQQDVVSALLKEFPGRSRGDTWRQLPIIQWAMPFAGQLVGSAELSASEVVSHGPKLVALPIKLRSGMREVLYGQSTAPEWLAPAPPRVPVAVGRRVALFRRTLAKEGFTDALIRAYGRDSRKGAVLRDFSEAQALLDDDMKILLAVARVPA